MSYFNIFLKVSLRFYVLLFCQMTVSSYWVQILIPAYFLCAWQLTFKLTCSHCLAYNEPLCAFTSVIIICNALLWQHWSVAVLWWHTNPQIRWLTASLAPGGPALQPYFPALPVSLAAQQLPATAPANTHKQMSTHWKKYTNFLANYFPPPCSLEMLYFYFWNKSNSLQRQHQQENRHHNNTFPRVCFTNEMLNLKLFPPPTMISLWLCVYFCYKGQSQIEAVSRRATFLFTNSVWNQPWC